MGYTIAQANEFINHIAPIIIAEADKRGYKIKSTVIAQAIVEGAAGTSKLAKNYHNHFGMKCGASWKGSAVNMATKEEYTKGTLTNINAYFRSYKSDEDGVAGYYDFIQSKRYANLKVAKDYADYARMLKLDGWATSSTYVNTLTNTVKKYGLDKYDDHSGIISRPLIKKGNRGDAVKLAQTLLIQKGYSCGAIDGIFGPKTEEAVKKFQADNINDCIIVDGIIGAKTWAKLESK